MSEPNFAHSCSQAVISVLETMFFTAALGMGKEETGSDVVEARIAFHGRPSGTVGIRLSAASARLLSAGFLGDDEDSLTGEQVGQVVCEFSNMLCGSLVSQFESEETFDLGAPELTPAGTVDSFCADAATRQSFELENGVLTVALCLEAFE